MPATDNLAALARHHRHAQHMLHDSTPSCIGLLFGKPGMAPYVWHAKHCGVWRARHRHCWLRLAQGNQVDKLLVNSLEKPVRQAGQPCRTACAARWGPGGPHCGQWHPISCCGG